MYTGHIDTQHDTHRLHNRPMSRGSALELAFLPSTSLDPIEITRFNTDDSGVPIESARWIGSGGIPRRRKASQICWLGSFNCTFLRRFCDCSRVFERFESVVVGSDLEIGFGEFERLWGMNEMMFRMMFEEFIFEFDLEERMGWNILIWIDLRISSDLWWNCFV